MSLHRKRNCVRPEDRQLGDNKCIYNDCGYGLRLCMCYIGIALEILGNEGEIHQLATYVHVSNLIGCMIHGRCI